MTSIIQRQLKLDLRPAQERVLNRWLWHLTGVYNWAIKKIERDARDGIYWSRTGFNNILAGHSVRLGIHSHVLQGTLSTAWTSWRRCFDGLSRAPKLKGRRNRLNSIPCPDPFLPPVGRRISVVGLGRLKFHPQDLPIGRIKSGRIVRRSSGWYLCLFIEAEPNAILITGHAEVGIDPGFSTLLTLSTGEKVEHPNELTVTSQRLAQAQRGKNRRLTARLREREGNQRKDRNHKLSRRFISEHALIAWSKDDHRAISKRFGKSVASAAHGQLRTMLAYKCRSGGRTFVEVSNRFSTVTCSACGQKTGPRGFAGLKVRQWVCGCGAEHDRDVNAAVNTLIAGRGLRLERARKSTSGIAA